MQAACAPHGDAASSLAADGDVKEDLRARRQWREHAPSACAGTAAPHLVGDLGALLRRGGGSEAGDDQLERRHRDAWRRSWSRV